MTAAEKPVERKIHIATPSEMKRSWVQTSGGVYASPLLAVDEGGSRVVDVDWHGALNYADDASNRTGRLYLVASYAEAIDAIKQSERANKEAGSFAEWTRNRYETIEQDGRKVTRVFEHSGEYFRGTDLPVLLKEGYIAGLNELGAPDAVSDEPNPDFLNARLWYVDNPVIRSWDGRFVAAAVCGTSYALGCLGFRLVWYEKQEAERILRGQNRQLRETNRTLARRIERVKRAATLE